MDRTSEFYKIIQSTQIPQQKHQTLANPHYELTHRLESLQSSISTLDRRIRQGEESLLFQDNINSCEGLIDECNNLLSVMEIADETKDEKNSNMALKEIFRTRLLKATLDLSNCLQKEEEKRKKKKERRKMFSISDTEHTYHPAAVQDMDVLMAENEIEVIHEKQRQQINMQINELGQLVSDLSMHISLQGESLKRIDDLVEGSDNYLKRSVDEINKTWSMISDRRKRMIKFFAFWILLAFIFYIIRR
ncbi:putative syntaxin-7B [Astathelohania contejeani]|uniref:Syntaxin-7B n=1 Tax=Astathelohania contejeani TaxID=164912 RepID=A0ABQ7HYY6_9MICR|nr:putative syntaxin-7B [Thelohania contejeani]